MRIFFALLLALASMDATQAQTTATQAPEVNTPRNDLQGSLAGQVDFAQTHVTAATRRIYDPFLVPHKDALIMFRPQHSIADVDLILDLDGKRTLFRMNRPTALPSAALFDKQNTFSGTIIEGRYPSFRQQTFSYQIPWNLFTANTQISFQDSSSYKMRGSLPKDKFLFMTPESEGLVLMNIKGCVFKDEAACRTTLDQFDSEFNPIAARIAAREMLSELPTQRLHLGVGRAYWPSIVALGADGKPRVYDTSNAMEWAGLGDKTLPAKVGMGNYWRAASVLGDKRPGYPVAISGQLLDVPDGMPVLPPGVGASCGGNSCNYPYVPEGFWHETGHGLGLPHDTPGRYEDWAYRAYDNIFLPNTHPSPAAYGLPVDYLGRHYFGHVVGSLAAAPWHPSTASAPLIDEFQSLGLNSQEGSSWKRYIAPFTHQQTLRVQQRFGRTPEGVEYAGIGDDHRPRPNTPLPPVTAPRPEKTDFLDAGIEPARIEPSLISPNANESPIEKGVPVHTLVITLSDPSHTRDGINQIYPAIISNYGNVYAPQHIPAPPPAAPNPKDSALMALDGRCLATEQRQLTLAPCTDAKASLVLQTVPPIGAEETRLAPIIIVRNNAGQCLEFNLVFRDCIPSEQQVRWRARKDLTHTDRLFKLQESNHGKFITLATTGTLQLQANSSRNELQVFEPGENRNNHRYEVEVKYADNSLETHSLYNGPFAKDILVVAALNVSSRRQPRSATLKVNGVPVHERQLETNLLPQVISFGAEHGQNIPEAWPPQWLYLPKYGSCLAASPQGTRLAACDEKAIWRLPQKNAYPHQFDSYEPVDMSGNCMSYQLASSTCKNTPENTLWWTRWDLTWSRTKIYLQEPQTGRFITARQGTDSLQLAGRSASEDQLFEKRSLPRVVLKQGNYSIEARAKTVIAAPNSNRSYAWYLVDALGNESPQKMPSFMLMSSDGQCLDDKLMLDDCAFPRTDNLTWLARNDLESGFLKMRLQNKKNGLFLHVADNGEVSLAPLAWSHNQVFSYFQPYSGQPVQPNSKR